MPLSSNINCSTVSSVTQACLDEAFLIKFSPLSLKVISQKKLRYTVP